MAMKSLHSYLALISISGLMLRGYWMWIESDLLQHRLVRILPHIVDTLFLLLGLALAHRIFQYPFTHDWMTAKLVGLVVYIILGAIALKRGKTRQIRGLTFLAALLVFAWVVSVAISKSPWGFLAGFA